MTFWKLAWKWFRRRRLRAYDEAYITCNGVLLKEEKP